MGYMQWIDVVAMTLTFTALIRPIIRALQRGNYKAIELYNILLTRYYKILLLMQVVMLAVVLSPVQYQSLLLAVGCVILTVIANKGKTKLPLKYTPRVVRLYLICLVLIFVVLVYVPSYIVPIFLPLIVLLALLITMPIEACVHRYYWVKARRVLANTTAVKIAVTGSYGKTSVKHILSHLLDGVATPASYNTPMGICRFVNSCQIDNYSYVVLEMGARHKGDIATLCHLIMPDMGVVVGVSPQHIATLGDMQGVISVKQELLNSMAIQGKVVLSSYDDIVSSWQDVGQCHKLLSGDIVSGDIVSMYVDHTVLDIQYQGNSYMVDIPLVGIAHSRNVLLAMSVALELGVDIDTLLDRVASVDTIAHRMQHISGAVHIIDDSYNANIDGIRLCCDSVACMQDIDTTIVIAQGIVEAGSMTQQLNATVGQLLSDAFDIVILTGVNSNIIAQHISQDTIVHIAPDVTSAVTIASRYYTDSCLLLFSNDIP